MSSAQFAQITRHGGRRTFSTAVSLAVAAFIYLAPLRRAQGEDRLDFKTLYYIEDGAGMKVVAPSVSWEKDYDSGLVIKIDGIYNSISGASPTGAPNTQTTITTNVTPGTGGGGSINPPRDYDDDEEDEHEEEDDDRRLLGVLAQKLMLNHALSGATPAPPRPSPPRPSPQPGGGGTSTTTNTTTIPLPKAHVEDRRLGLSLEVARSIGRFTPAASVSYSNERDYQSIGGALRTAVDFNEKNTTLVIGSAYTYDIIKPATWPGHERKDTVDLMAGVTQLLDKRTLFTLNYTYGMVEGFLADPYKVAMVNGTLLAEKRPDSKDKQILFTALTRFVEALRGSAELSYRRYEDTFGIGADTVSFAWYQRLGNKLIVRPAIRYYVQGEADFYRNQFAGSPEFYSADYRLSAFHDLGYGLKIVWKPLEALALDVTMERFEMEGDNGSTPPDAYPSANVIIGGIRWTP